MSGLCKARWMSDEWGSVGLGFQTSRVQIQMYEPRETQPTAVPPHIILLSVDGRLNSVVVLRVLSYKTRGLWL